MTAVDSHSPDPAGDTGQLRLVRVPLDHPDAQLLVEEVQAEYVRRYGGRDDTPVDPDEFEPPRGGFHIALLDGVPVASGAWRWREDLTVLGVQRPAELKRMYVRPAWQRRGIARAVLAHLEAEAQAAGARVVVLETGTAQPEAIAFYEASGYEPVASFGHYRESELNRCFARRIGGPAVPL